MKTKENNTNNLSRVFMITFLFCLVLFSGQLQAQPLQKSQGQSFPKNNTGDYLTTNNYWSRGKTLKTVVVPVNFSDYALTYTQAQIDSALNGVNYTAHGLKGSVRDYYSDMSGGKFIPQFEVLPPYTVSQARSSSESNLISEVQSYVNLVLRERALDEFDSDGNGYIDHISIVFAGQGSEISDDAGLYASYFPALTCYQSLGNTYSSSYSKYDITIVPEIDNYDSKLGIELFCQQFAHVLGLPAFYDTDGASNGQSEHPGYHDLMSSYSATGNPAALSAFSRYVLGWLNLKTVGTAASITLSDIADEKQALRINTTTAGEFFVLENRQNSKWNIPNVYEGNGLLVFRVDSVWYNSHCKGTCSAGVGGASWRNQNNVNAFDDHLGYALIAADNNMSANYTTDFFPAGATQLTDATTPSMKSLAGANTGKPITNIAESNGNISFNLSGGGNGLIVSTHSVSVAGGGKVRVEADVLVAGNESVTERGVCYGLLPTPSVSGNKVTDTSGNNSFTAEITGLTPGTTYYFRAYAKNSGGTAVYGAAKQITAEKVLKITSEYTVVLEDLQIVGEYSEEHNELLVDISEMQEPVIEIYFGNKVGSYQISILPEINGNRQNCVPIDITHSNNGKAKYTFELSNKSGYYRIIFPNTLSYADTYVNKDSVVIREKMPAVYAALPYSQKYTAGLYDADSYSSEIPEGTSMILNLNTLGAAKPLLHLKGYNHYSGVLSVRYKTGGGDYQYLALTDRTAIPFRKVVTPGYIANIASPQVWRHSLSYYVVGDYFAELPQAEDLTLFITNVTEANVFDYAGTPVLHEVSPLTTSVIEATAIVYNPEKNTEYGLCWYPASGAANTNNKIVLDGQGLFTRGFTEIPNVDVYVATYKTSGGTSVYSTPVLTAIVNGKRIPPAAAQQPAPSVEAEHAPSLQRTAQSVSAFPYTFTMGERGANTDFTGWTLSPAGAFHYSNTTDLVTPELDLSGLDNPTLCVGVRSGVTVSVSANGTDFTNVAVNAEVALASNIKYVKLHLTGSYWGVSEAFALWVYDADTPYIISHFPYTAAYADNMDLFGWTLTPAGIFSTTSTTDLMTPELDLSGLTNPYLGTSGNGVTFSVSENGTDFTTVAAGVQPLTSNIKYIKIHRDESRWGTQWWYSNFTLTVLDMTTSAVTQFPWIVTNDSLANKSALQLAVSGWTLTPAGVFNSSNTTEILTPELDLSSLITPTLSASGSDITVYTSPDSAAFTPIALGINPLPANTKYLKVTKNGSSWSNFKLIVSNSATDKSETVISQFPWTLSFNKNNPGNIGDWQLMPGVMPFSTTETTGLITPELDLSALWKPALKVTTSYSGANVSVSVSTDGINYTNVAKGEEVALADNVKFVKLHRGASYWGSDENFTISISDKMRDPERPIEVLGYQSGQMLLRVWFKPEDLAGGAAQGICWSENSSLYNISAPTITNSSDYVEDEMQEIRYFTIPFTQQHMKIRPFVMTGTAAIKYDTIQAISKSLSEDAGFLDKTVTLPYTFHFKTNQEYNNDNGVEKKYWKRNVAELGIYFPYYNPDDVFVICAYPSNSRSEADMDKFANYPDTVFLQSMLINQQGANNPQLKITVYNETSGSRSNSNQPVKLFAVNETTGVKTLITTLVPNRDFGQPLSFSTKNYGDSIRLRFEMPLIAKFALSQFEIEDSREFLVNVPAVERQDVATVKFTGSYQPAPELPAVTEAGFVWSITGDPLNSNGELVGQRAAGVLLANNTIDATIVYSEIAHFHVRTYVKNSEGYSYSDVVSETVCGKYIVSATSLPVTDNRTAAIHSVNGSASTISVVQCIDTVESTAHWYSHSGILQLTNRPAVNKIQAVISLSLEVYSNVSSGYENFTGYFSYEYRVVGSQEWQSLSSGYYTNTFVRKWGVPLGGNTFQCDYQGVLQLPRNVEQIRVKILKVNETYSGGIGTITYSQSNVADLGSVPPVIEVLTVNNGQLEVQWSINDMQNLEKVRLYRESTTAGSYTMLQEYPLAQISAGSVYTFNDNTANPASRAYKYRAVSVNNEGTEFAGTEHKSVHLSINRGILDQWNLYWTPYEGLATATVRIYRGTTTASLVYLDEVSGTSNTYTDVSAPAGTLYYVVEMVFANPSPAPRQTLQRVVTTAVNSRSNVASNVTTVAVTGVSLNITNQSLLIGDQLSLTAAVSPSNATNQNVTWASTNSAIASVTQTGEVTALSEGNTTITVTTQDGGFVAQCSITVAQGVVAVTGIQLNKTTSSLAVGASEQLVATVLPTNATNQNVTWTSTNSSVASVTQTGMVTALSEGNTLITVTTLDGGYTATCNVTVLAQTVAVTGIQLNKTTSSLAIGATEQLIATVLPSNATNKNVIWSSSNMSVASVTQTGMVTALSEGNTLITVTTLDGGYAATCNVTVLAQTVAVTGIQLNKTTSSLAIGATEQLIATVLPSNATNQNLTWASSNTSVASVTQNGVVTALSEGNTIITVTTQDGGYAATCNVTVLAQTVAVTGIQLNKTTSSPVVGTSEQLIATVLPANATNQNVTWSSSNSSVASVTQNGLVTALAEGNAIIEVSTQDGGFTAQCSVIIQTSGIDDLAQMKILLYPNPTQNNLFVKSEGANIETIFVYNLTGESKKVDVSGFNEYTVDLSLLPDGVYIVELKTDRGIYRQKIVKQ